MNAKPWAFVALLAIALAACTSQFQQNYPNACPPRGSDAGMVAVRGGACPAGTDPGVCPVCQQPPADAPDGGVPGLGFCTLACGSDMQCATWFGMPVTAVACVGSPAGGYVCMQRCQHASGMGTPEQPGECPLGTYCFARTLMSGGDHPVCVSYAFCPSS